MVSLKFKGRKLNLFSLDFIQMKEISCKLSQFYYLQNELEANLLLFKANKTRDYSWTLYFNVQFITIHHCIENCSNMELLCSPYQIKINYQVGVVHEY